MSSRDQLSKKTSDHSTTILPEGFLTLTTSAGNLLYFKDPTEMNNYKSANPAQCNIKI